MASVEPSVTWRRYLLSEKTVLRSHIVSTIMLASRGLSRLVDCAWGLNSLQAFLTGTLYVQLAWIIRPDHSLAETMFVNVAMYSYEAGVIFLLLVILRTCSPDVKRIEEMFLTVLGSLCAVYSVVGGVISIQYSPSYVLSDRMVWLIPVATTVSFMGASFLTWIYGRKPNDGYSPIVVEPDKLSV